jgi:hypothetical protein
MRRDLPASRAVMPKHVGPIAATASPSIREQGLEPRRTAALRPGAANLCTTGRAAEIEGRHTRDALDLGPRLHAASFRRDCVCVYPQVGSARADRSRPGCPLGVRKAAWMSEQIGLVKHPGRRFRLKLVGSDGPSAL